MELDTLKERLHQKRNVAVCKKARADNEVDVAYQRGQMDALDHAIKELNEASEMYHGILTLDQNTYRISGLQPKSNSFGFKLSLNDVFAEQLESIHVPDQQNAASDSLIDMYLEHPNARIQFKGDSFLLANITVAFDATGLDLTDRFDYHTHNVDTAKQAIEILAVFSKWAELGHTLLAEQ